MASHSSDGQCETREPGASRKRKGRDVIAASHPDPDPIRSTKADPAPLPMPPPPPRLIQAAGGGGGKLLAGYLAHEFLTRGTLFGRHWDPAAARPPLAKERHRSPPLADRQQQQEERKPPTPPEMKEEKPPATAYAEVAYLLKEDGGGIPGVVNPTQLVRWLQM